MIILSYILLALAFGFYGARFGIRHGHKVANKEKAGAVLDIVAAMLFLIFLVVIFA